MRRVFCNPNCREGWITDRRYGLIYGAIFKEDGRYKNHLQYHEDAGNCPYCLARVVTRRKREVYAWKNV